MKHLVIWFSENHVAANLLMAMILVGGFLATTTIVQEVFPETELDLVTVSVIFLGGTPAEVEESICVKIEEQVQGVDGIKKVTSRAGENLGVVVIELELGTDKRKAYDDIKSEIDRIVTFPENTERPIVNLVEIRRPVLDVIIFGDTDERSLKVLADRLRDDLMTSAGITYAEVRGTRPYEISIEVSETKLRSHGLSLADVTRAVRANSLDMPGGAIKTQGGEILLRTKGQRYTGDEFARLVAIGKPDGSRVYLDELAEIRDSFEDIDMRTRMGGRPAAIISVYRSGRENVLEVASTVKQHLVGHAQDLPEGIATTIWRDRSVAYQDRMNLLLKNGAMGLGLVFLVLAMTMQLRLAIWVSLGILISFLGGLWVLPWFGISLNMISLFAFILSLGIVVDNAIVIGESIFARRERGEGPQLAATRGALEVSVPILFAVLTTVVAFAPLIVVEGMMGRFMKPASVVVIAVLTFSLIQALLILPSHLTTIARVRLRGEGLPAELQTARGLTARVHRFKHQVSASLERFVQTVYRRHLIWALGNRSLVIACAAAVMLVTLGFSLGGHQKFVFMPRIESDTVVGSLTLPQGTTLDESLAAVRRLEDALEEVRRELKSKQRDGDPDIVKNVQTIIGSQPLSAARGGAGSGGSGTGAHLIEISAELLGAQERTVSAGEIARRWREKTGPIAGAVELSFSADLFQPGMPIQVQLASPNTDDLIAAAAELKGELAAYPGVIDITDSFREGKLELQLDLTDEARSLGLSLDDLARQVRQGFYGAEVMRLQRGRDEVKVMVRFPEAERTSLGHIENMMVRTPDAREAPFDRVATTSIGRGYASIDRSQRQRVISVFGDVEATTANAAEVLRDLEARVLPDLLSRFPGLSYDLEGQEQERQESIQSLMRGYMMALFVIYTLLAVLFRSYLQPLLVMSAIPYGIVGAVWGHVLMGWDLTLLSLFGVVALSGVVVNSSLLLIDFVNRARRAGLSVEEAVIESGVRRFRPILLTAMTTFLGLTPLLMETSLQAQFLIPMAISLGFGVLFATAITLLLVPVSYSALVSAKRFFGLRDEVWVPQGEAQLDESDIGLASDGGSTGGSIPG